MLKAITLGLFLTSFFAYAGQVQQIRFEDNRLSIQHTACQIQTSMQEPTKLIIPLQDCMSYAGELQITQHPTVKKIHWAQHDKNSVWIVVTLKPDYQFELQPDTHQLSVCFPQCGQTICTSSTYGLCISIDSSISSTAFSTNSALEPIDSI